MTYPLSLAHALPAIAALAAAFLLAGALPREVAADVGPIVVHAASLPLTGADLRACELRGDSSHDACIEEAQGKALIRSAERVAELDSRSGLALGDELIRLPPGSGARQRTQ